MAFLKALVGRTITWLIALGVGATEVLVEYFRVASTGEVNDPIELLLRGGLITLLVKVFGALGAAGSKKLPPPPSVTTQ